MGKVLIKAMTQQIRRSFLLAAAVVSVALVATGCTGPSKAEPKLREVQFTTFLIDVRFDGLELNGPQGGEISKFTATGNHVALWFKRKKMDNGEFEMNVGKQAIKGTWTLYRSIITMTVNTVDGKEPTAGSAIGPFEFHPPRYVDDAFAICTKATSESQAASPIYLVRNVGQDKYWEMDDGTSVKPSRTLLLLP